MVLMAADELSLLTTLCIRVGPRPFVGSVKDTVSRPQLRERERERMLLYSLHTAMCCVAGKEGKGQNQRS